MFNNLVASLIQYIISNDTFVELLGSALDKKRISFIAHEIPASSSLLIILPVKTTDAIAEQLMESIADAAPTVKCAVLITDDPVSIVRIA